MIGTEHRTRRPMRAAGRYVPLNFSDKETQSPPAENDAALPAYRAGDCETCGQWDSELQEGMCQWCRQQYGLAERL